VVGLPVREAAQDDTCGEKTLEEGSSAGRRGQTTDYRIGSCRGYSHGVVSHITARRVAADLY